MTKAKKIWTAALLAVVFLAGFALFLFFQMQDAAAPVVESDRLARATALRAEYPYRDDKIPAMASTVPFDVQYPEPDSWMMDQDALLLVQVTGEWIGYDRTLHPTGDSEDGLAMTVRHLYLPVQVLEVLGTKNGEAFTTNTVWLRFSGLTFTGQDTIHPGDTMILPVMYAPDDTYEGEMVCLAGALIYHLSPTDPLAAQPASADVEPVAVSLSSEPAIDALSGLTLSQFEVRIRQVMVASGWDV